MVENQRLRVGFRTNSIAPERLRYIRQLGVTDVFINPVTPAGVESGDIFVDNTDQGDENDRLVLAPDNVPSAARLEKMREQCEQEGISLQGIHTLQFNMYGDIMLNNDGADRQLEAIKKLLSNMGEAGLPILGYQWNPRGVVPMRTGTTTLRGGAEATHFNLSEIEAPDNPVLEREYVEDDLWKHYESFVDEIIPAAEHARVKMALHPVDPPTIPTLMGIPRLFRSTQSFERALDLRDSEYHGLKLCLGCFSEMGEDIIDVIHRFGERQRIVFVHFRDVVGTAEAFHETFVDCGNFDEVRAMKALKEVDFKGVIIPDHVPNVTDDTDWGHRARGYTAGYLRGVINSLSLN